MRVTSTMLPDMGLKCVTEAWRVWHVTQPGVVHDKAQECYQKYTDEHHSPAPLLKIGNQVYVKAKYFCITRPLKKLSKKNLGPYEVIAIPGSLIHPSPTWSFPLCPSHLPHIPTRTSGTRPISTMHPTPVTSSRDWQWYWSSMKSARFSTQSWTDISGETGHSAI